MSNSTDLLKGKKVIVIGGSSGIGRSVAAATLAHGASVVIASSSQEKVNAALDRLKQGVSSQSNVYISGQALDLKEFAALKAFLTKEGPFDHPVITAGDHPGNLNFPEQDLEIQSLINSFDVRYWAIMTAAQHIYKNKLINPGGSITLTIGVQSGTQPAEDPESVLGRSGIERRSRDYGCLHPPPRHISYDMDYARLSGVPAARFCHALSLNEMIHTYKYRPRVLCCPNLTHSSSNPLPLSNHASQVPEMPDLY
ncbi:hypothetical protein ACGC1H_005917 [Rhizoctonia solani]